MKAEHRVGAFPVEEGVRFCVWAPYSHEVSLVVDPTGPSWMLERLPDGYHHLTVPGLGTGARYRYSLDGADLRADPASRSQPDGVHGPSEVIDVGAYDWGDGGYTARALRQHVISEIHVGSFTAEGTFDAVIGRLGDLVGVGISAVEIMPVAQFPGARNWGYDGVFPFAVQQSYGGAAGLQRMVDACHQHGVAVILDVVYNHLGPEGDVLAAFGPYFTDRYRTPWGPAVNLDGRQSDHVRSYFLQNAGQWLEDFHIDGLRLDAVHEFIDRTATPFLVDLSRTAADVAARSGRPRVLIAESADNDPRLTTSLTHGGLGQQAQWNDDFHHALHAVLTGESSGYYADFGRLEQLATALAQDFVYAGTYSGFRDRRHGARLGPLPSDRFVHFAQNHDQIGNRGDSARLSTLVPFERLRMAAAVVLLAPGVPLLFMGEEYGEVAPFPYFVDHGDAGLIEAVRRGRGEEFPDVGRPGARYDPADAGSMHAARPDPSLRQKGDHSHVLALHRRLIELRGSHAALQERARPSVDAWATGSVITLVRRASTEEVVALFNLSDAAGSTDLPQHPSAPWRRLVDSGDPEFGRPDPFAPETTGGGAHLTLPPWAFCAYARPLGGGA
jgi:maltooligosyltrehalose trehalohydrolase